MTVSYAVNAMPPLKISLVSLGVVPFHKFLTPSFLTMSTPQERMEGDLTAAFALDADGDCCNRVLITSKGIVR